MTSEDDPNSNLHDLLHQIKNVELPGDNGNPYSDHESKDQAEANAAEFLKSQDYFAGNEYADHSNAGDQDYLDYGRYINQSLSTYSIPCPYTGPIDFDFKVVSSRVKVVNTILELLSQREQSKDFILEAEAVIQDLQMRKRDAEQRSLTIRKECALQKRKISALTSKIRSKEVEGRKKQAGLNDKLRKVKSQKLLEKQHLTQTITEGRKKDDNIKELRLKAMGQIDQHEKRMKVHLGMKPINDEMAFRRQRARSDRNGREEFEHIKRELQMHNEKVNELAKENQQLKQNLMTLRLEVKLLGENNGDGVVYEEDIPMDKLDVNPHLFEMPYDMVRNHVKADTRKDLKAFREQRERREGSRRSQISIDHRGGENPEGPIPKHISKSRGSHVENIPEFGVLEQAPDYNLSFEDLLDGQTGSKARSDNFGRNRGFDSFSDLKSDF